MDLSWLHFHGSGDGLKLVLPVELSTREQRWQISNSAHPQGPVPAKQLPLKGMEMLPDRFLQVLQSRRFRQTELYRGCNSSCGGSGVCGPAALFFSDFISSHTCGRDEGESHPLFLKHKISVVWSTRLLLCPPASLSANLKGKQTYTGAGKITHTQTLRFCCVSLNLNALKQNVAQERDLFSGKTDRGREREKNKREIEAEKDGERETRVKNRHITMPEKNQNIFQRKMGHFQILVPYQTN